MIATLATAHNIILLSIFVLLVHISVQVLVDLLKSVGFAESCLFQCSQPPKKQIRRSLVAVPRLLGHAAGQAKKIL